MWMWDELLYGEGGVKILALCRLLLFPIIFPLTAIFGLLFTALDFLGGQKTTWKFYSNFVVTVSWPFSPED
jgi:hypothetical protein